MTSRAEIEALIGKAAKAEKSEDAMRFSQAACNAANALHAARSADTMFGSEPTEAQIKTMVDRFLGWPVPADFSPDGGIKFEPSQMLGGGFHRPVGTNLLTATQAEAMVRHMLTAS